MIIPACRAMLIAHEPLALAIGFRATDVNEGQGLPLPRLTLLLVSDVPKASHDGYGLTTARVQIDVYATSGDEAGAVAALVTQALLSNCRATWAGSRILGIAPVGHHGDAGSPAGSSRRILEFMVTYTEV